MEIGLRVDQRLRGRILVVDDRRDVRHLARHFVEKAGGEVILATDGVEALACVEAAERANRPVDLVLMDLQMPRMDGASAARALRERGFTAPLIALTARAMSTDRTRCLQDGFNDYIAKPIDKARLIAVIAEHLAGNGAGNPPGCEGDGR